MSFSHLLRKFSQPNLAHSAANDANGSGPPDDSNRPTQRQQTSKSIPTVPPLWRKKKRSTAEHSDPSRPTSAPSITPYTESPTSGNGGSVLALCKALPAIPNTSPTNQTMVPPLEMLPAIRPVSDMLTEAWDAVKDDPKVENTCRELDTLDDVVSTTQSAVAPFIPIMKATVAAVEQTDIGKAMKDGIDKFAEGIPVFIKALDELKALHPFIGAVVLAFETAYNLWKKVSDNDKKIILLYVKMKDMVGALLRLKDVENDKIIAPDGMTIEGRLGSLIECTAEDIKMCCNVCDAYTKKRLLAKVLLSSVWEAKLLDFAELFTTRRQEFLFELAMHTSQAVDKANAKLDAIGNSTTALSEQMNAMKAMFEQLVSPEQKLLSELVTAKGGTKALQRDAKMLLYLEETASKGSSPASVEGYRTSQAKLGNADLKVDDLRGDIFEHPSAAAEKNWTVFSRRFEAQKNQIIDELTLAVRRESDRVIQELKGGAHERILDRSIHDIWVDMGWRGNVKARHFVLALRDYYLEKITSETENVLSVRTSAINTSSNPDAWAIKFIDIMWVEPILEAFDDDASGFITVAEVNRFTSSRPADWSLPHWLAYWAVGFKWSMIEYANKIEELFAKMEGLRTVVLPPNRDAVDLYFAAVWMPIHTLTAAVLSLSSRLDDSTKFKFKPYLEAEEARLGKNLRAVNYIIDGTDSLELITGIGRIEKTAFPLLYLLLKRHYEIMRVMRTKVPNMRDLTDGMQCIQYVQDTNIRRLEELAHNFSHQRLDPGTRFQSFAYGIFKYGFHSDALWSEDYVRTLDPKVIPYNDENEDQNVQPGDILNYEYKDELSLDNWVYDGHSTDDIPSHREVEAPLRDMGPPQLDDDVRSGAAEGERDIKANGWSVRGGYTITGSWSMDEDNAIQINLKISFLIVFVPPMFFSGRFDPERDALTGVSEWSVEQESFAKNAEFRRILPRHFIVYPSMKELADSKPRALWRFAITAVRNDIRRNHWSWSYFSQRRDDREMAISLLIRSRWFGKPLSSEEAQTCRAILRRLTSADACFYHSKVNRIRAYTWIHRDVDCDSCDGPIGGPRLFCLDCASTNTGSYNSLDLCCAPECAGARVTREDLTSAHEPYHRLVKARTTVLIRNQGRAHTAACEAFERAKGLCIKIAELSSHPHEEIRPDEQKTSSFEPTLTEVHAKSDKLDDVLIAPDGSKGGIICPDVASVKEVFPSHSGIAFFAKVDNLFICNACDAEGVPDIEPEKVGEREASPTEQRFTSIDGRLGGMQTQLDDLTGRMGDLAGYIGDLNARIGNLEQLVQKLAGARESAA
ncbi:hypothetical protein BJV74DRAFT_883811 [Russula compacta]|nr:hypothetical protein BJV74DRAFT_883811 [Russula compacta]